MTQPQPPYVSGAPQPTGFQVPPQPAEKRRRWPWIAAGAVVLVLLGALAWSLAAGRSFTIDGTLVLDRPCSSAGSGGFDDIQQGAQVVVTDAGGKSLAIGTLGAPQDGTGITCRFAFTVEGVPSGHDIYGIEVTHRGVLQYPAEKFREPLQLTLG